MVVAFTLVGILVVLGTPTHDVVRALQLPNTQQPPQLTRRTWIQTAVTRATGVTTTTTTVSALVWLAAPPTSSRADSISVRDEIAEATRTLQYLLDHWNNAVVDCTYADVPRELLESKNKELLLEKAKVSALFDKSASIVSCKTTNRVVRDYLGHTGKGPLVGMEKKLRQGLDLVENPDDFDDYLQTVEAIQQALARANSLSYTAGIADFSAVNNFDQEDELGVLEANNNLSQVRSSIQTSVDGLNHILTLINTR